MNPICFLLQISFGLRLCSEFLKEILAHFSFVGKANQNKGRCQKSGTDFPFYDNWTYEYDAVTILYVEAFNKLFPFTKKAPCKGSNDKKAHHQQSNTTTNYCTEITTQR